MQSPVRLLRQLQGTRRGIATGGYYLVPKPFKEPNVSNLSCKSNSRRPLKSVQFDYVKGSPERQKLVTALNDLRSKLPVQVPARGGPASSKPQANAQRISMSMPSEHGNTFAQYADASESDVSAAIESALSAKSAWQDMPFTDRAAVFLRTAELVSGKYRYELMAATMLGQGKNAWQAEIDAAAELADFFRFNVGFAQEIYDKQPTINSPGHHGRTDWRPLEGFVYAVSPFNFTAIGGNLISAPALMGNVVVWKPSAMSVYPSYLVHKILLEAGLPPGVIQLVNGDSANKDSQLERVVGGTYDGSKGFYIDPTIYVSKTPDHLLLEREIFGPVLTAHIYPDAEFDNVLDTIDRQGGGFALTGAIFSNDQAAIGKAENRLRWAAGNFYINCKTTGAVIGQQSFGGSRASGTNDKAGSVNLLISRHRGL